MTDTGAQVAEGRPTPTGSRRASLAAVLVSVTCLLAAVAVVVSRDDESRSDEPAAGMPQVGGVVDDTPMSVSVNGPRLDRLVVGDVAALSVEVVADAPVTDVELWVDDERIGERTLDEPASTVRADWEWSPRDGGLHAVFARVVDDNGAVGLSAPRWARVLDPVAAAAKRPARERGVGSEGPGSSDARRTPAAEGESAAGPWRAAENRDGCAVGAVVPPRGETLLVAPPTVGAFIPIIPAPGAKPGDALSIPLVSGPTLLVVRGDGAVATPKVALGAARCSASAWSGDARIIDGRLHVHGDAPRAYLYLSVDDGPWQRVPATDGAFAERAADGSYDLDGILPSVSGSSLRLEAWGRGADGALVDLGSGVLTPPETFHAPASGGGASLGDGFADVSLDAFVGGLLRTDLDWIAAKAKAKKGETAASPEVLAREVTLEWDGTTLGLASLVGIGPSTLDFRWKANNPSATHIVWQVSEAPPPTGPSLVFPGLLAYKGEAGAAGEFTFDVDTIFAGEGPTSTGVGTPSGPAVAFDSLSPKGLGLVFAGGAAAPASDKSAVPVIVDVPDGPVAEMPPALYVRAVPMAGTQPLAEVSNIVRLDIGLDNGLKLPTPPPSAPKPEVASMTVVAHPPSGPNQKYARCVRVVANPHGSANPAPVAAMQPFYDDFAPAPVGKTLCPGYDEPDESWWDVVTGAIEFAAAVWDEVAAFVNDLKDDLIELAAQFGCKPWAEAHWGTLPSSAKAELKKQGIDGPMDLCTTMIGTAVDVYLTANGIPPTLPSSSAALATFKGNLADAAAAEIAKACPGVVKDECQKQAKAYVDKLMAKIQAETSAAAVSGANSGNYYLYLSPDIVVVPEPAGQFVGAIWEVTLTLEAPAPEATSCGLLGRVSGTHPAWKYRKPINASDIKWVTEKITGPVVTPAGGAVEVLKGQSVVKGYLVADQLDRQWHPIPADHWNSDPFWWAWWDPKATLTMTLEACGQPTHTVSFPGGIATASGPSAVVLP